MLLALLLVPLVGVEGFGVRTFNFPRYAALNRVQLTRESQITGEVEYLRGGLRLFSSEADGDSEGFGEDLTYLNEEFSRLAKGKQLISFQDFLGSEAIQAILTDEDADNYLSDIRDIWVSQTKSIDTAIDLTLFVLINRQIDDLFEYVDDDDEEDARIGEDDELNAEAENGIRRDIVDGRNNNEEEEETGEIIEVRDMDIWDESFDVKEYFGLDFLKYLKKFFDANTDDKNKVLLSFSSFIQWTDVKGMLADGEIDAQCLTELWNEAIVERNNRKIKTDEVPEEKKGFKAESDDSKRGFLDFEQFARMNVRLDVVLDEVKDALGNLTDQEVEEYYRAEFGKLSEGDDLISYTQLLSWTDIQQMVEDGGLTLDQVAAMWEALPKRPLGSFFKKSKERSLSQSEGISVEAFLLFNTGLEDLDSEIPDSALE